ncbi:acyl-CoA N-acyltransferase [Globomyces pollinis-pini]|nr:acyl-CoA N-acyltransferase [Globomyces pollinis-pini]
MNLLPVGSKLPVSKGTGDQLTWHQAEILSIRFPEGDVQYYVHFDLYNKRLDEWVTPDRMDLTKLKPPSPKKKPAPPTQKVKQKANKTPASDKKRKREHSKALLDTADSAQSLNTVDEKLGDELEGTFSKEKEIEKLRTSGSMTQSQTEISRCKNINRIGFGKNLVDTWYFSPYPEEFTKLDTLFICEFCLEPVGTEFMLSRHREKCLARHPPGNEIYRHGTLSFFEIDGQKSRHYCRNLCLISKLFLDHKTLYYDVDPFLYYIMTRNDDRGMHLIGYFSKEKQSAEEYNVACILTLPQFQRMGYGKLLIAFSYELSLIEKKTGSPEKPLSDLGLLSYRSYWADVIVGLLMECAGEMSIQEISEITSITIDDIMNTLNAMDMLKYYKGQFILYISEKMVLQYEKSKSKKRERIDPKKLEWVPPKFLPAQLRFL